MAPPFGNLSNQPVIIRGDRPAGTPSENHVVTVQGADAGYPLTVTQGSAVWITEDAADGTVGSAVGDTVIWIGGLNTANNEYAGATFTNGNLNVNATFGGTVSQDITAWGGVTLDGASAAGTPATGNVVTVNIAGAQLAELATDIAAAIVDNPPEVSISDQPINVNVVSGGGSPDVTIISPLISYGSPNEEAVAVYVVNSATGNPQIGNPPSFAFVGVASVQILAPNPLRTACVITNFSYETISLAFDHAAIQYGGMILGPGGSMATNVTDNFQGALYAISTANFDGGYVAIEEWN